MTNKEAIEFLKNMIDRESFIIPKGAGDFEKYHIEALQMSIKALSVDSVEVVRCKDCKHWHEDVANFISSIPRGGCKLVRGITNGEFFCAMGERKE